MAKNIYKRGDTYYLRLMVKGKRFNRSLETSILAEAKRKAQAVERDILEEAEHAKRSPSGQAHTLSSFWKDVYSPDCLELRWNEKGQKNSTAQFEQYIEPELGHFRLDQIRRPDLLGFAATLSKTELSPVSQKHVLSLLRGILNYAGEVEALAAVPSFKRVMPKVPEALPRRLSDEEMEAVIAEAKGPNGHILRLLFETGLRWGEVQRLEPRHVKLGDNPRLELEQTKSGKVRRVPLSPLAVPAIKALLQWPGRTPRFVVPMRSEHPGFLYRRSKIKWHVHQTRHTFAARFLESGGSLAVLQELLGHSSPLLTAHYGRLAEQSVETEARNVFARQSGTNTGTKAETKKRKASK